MKIAPDKRLHLFFSFLMDICLLFALYLLEVKNGIIIANAITALFWIGKEVWDCFKPNPTGFSFGDLLADLIGMIVANVVFFIYIQ